MFLFVTESVVDE